MADKKPSERGAGRAALPKTAPTAVPEDWTATILDSVADGVFTVDQDWRITFFNRAAERITGIPRHEALGRPCCEVFRADICEGECALRQTMALNKPVLNRPIEILRGDGRRIPISVSTAILHNARGDVLGGVETFRDLSLVENLRKELSGRYTFADIISKNRKMQELFALLPRLAESGSTVLVTGESGTGKELVARALHSLSPRKARPFIAVNCAALPDTLLESELFGHVAGAFTDARKDREGYFAEAEGGSLFLDEIGDISPAMQVRLLRVLQERKFQPVGSSRARKADVRVLCATNRPLEKLVRQDRFRQDLFYRINVMRISIPPLRERKEDVPLLAEHFVERFGDVHGRKPGAISAQALARLMAYDWPGNVRELENAIEHACVLAQGGVLTVAHLPEHLRGGDETTLPAGTTLAEIEARAVYEALRRNNWKKLATARELGINKTTLWRKLRALKITLPAQVDGE